jgi:hypothetical protein
MRRFIATCRWFFVFAAALVLLFISPQPTLGQSCRVVEHTVKIAGVAVPAIGTICPRFNGRWVLARWRVRDRIASPD